MADFLDETADYLATQGIGTVGTDIFVGDVPPDPNNLVSLFGITGSNLNRDSRQVGTLHFPRFQVFVRNTDYANASAKLEAVRTALHAKYGIALPNWRIMALHADQEGGPIGKDGEGRFEFTINLTAELNAETAA